MRFDTLLVANRGEIALRILRAARLLGLRTVAVYADADAQSAHVRAADLAVHIGPTEAARSYRNVEALIEACRRTGAQALHPGYGFLSENAAFAQAVIDAGLVFVGPSPEVIELMGNKARAKLAMQQAGVPTVPGEPAGVTDEQARAAAARIGYPVILKAASGGGGRGMRIVREADALLAALRQARSEALGAFGSDEVIIERAIEQGRHIEIQVLCDEHGQCLHLGERDCSTQRRFQKLIEEAPSPAVDAALRQAMGDVAVRACQAISYTGAGTLEFLLDRQGRFYFMEMNTRLQVEHGVTELVTGLDLVELQLRVAQGEALTLTQADILLEGHAIEVRLCAEDPVSGFLPQVGRVGLWRPAPEIRVDSALEDGMEIAAAYDSMVAKLMVWGKTREESLHRLARACTRTALLGVRTNLGFLARCLEHPRFVKGEVATDFLAHEDLGSPAWCAHPSAHAWAVAVLVQAGLANQTLRQRMTLLAGSIKTRTFWLEDLTQRLKPDVCAVEIGMSADIDEMSLRLRFGEPAGARKGTEAATQADELVCTVDHLRWESVAVAAGQAGIVGLAVGGVYRQLFCHAPCPGEWWVQDGADSFVFRRMERFESRGDEEARSGSVRAPMSGRVVAVMVAAGDSVVRGQALVVLESMKMEIPLTAPRTGHVGRLLVQTGMQLNAGQIVVEVAASPDAQSEAAQPEEALK